MRLAFVNDTFLEGRGADVVIYELARRMGAKHEVFVLAGETNIQEENFKFIKLSITKLFTGGWRDLLYFQKMRILKGEIEKLDKKYSFDKIIVFHGGLSPAFKKNEKVFYDWLGSPPTKNILRKLTSRYFQRLMISNEIITISDYLECCLKKIGAKKTKVIRLGVSKEFKPAKKKTDRNFMLYVGRLEKHKRVEQLVKISKSVDFPLKIVGYGPEEKNLKKLAEKINARVEFLGRVSRKELIINYQSCSFFVSASKWEGFGLIFIEAGACGKPSIGYDEGSISEIIKNNETGFVVGNLKEFLEKATLFKEKKQLRFKMGERARIFSKTFNWDKISKEYEREFGA